MTAAPIQAASDDHTLASELATYLPLLARLRTGRPPAADWSNIVDEAALVSARPGFDTLLTARQLRFEPFDYQIRAAQTVLRRMRGRGILADEVGLGKTIEAGLVLSELRLRGLAERILVVTPAGIVGQWCDELERKFGLPTEIARPGRDLGTDRSVTVASLASARRAPMLPELTEHEWDLVIFDEAHRLRNPRSASGKLAREIRTRYLLMLTATPVENRLADLYQLVSLVAPGLLGTPAQFRSRHGGSDAAARHVDELRTKTREVMVRHRRSEVAVLLPHRVAETVLVPPAPDEAALYADIVESVRVGATASASSRLALRGLVRLAGSSPAATAATLDKLGHADLAERARRIAAPAKTRALVETLARHVARGEKVLVFTGFRATLESLAAAVRAAGVEAAVYHGSMSRTEKDAAVARFAADAPVLLSTESAGEGRNLQFCHVLVNYDLPWNPMQIEQRVGRLHRVGQEHDVTLINLVGRDTIEQRIMSVLEAKINLFELVVGELDMILGRIDDDFDFETAIFDALIAGRRRQRIRSASRHARRRVGRRAHRLSHQPRRGRRPDRRNRMTVTDAGLSFWLRYVDATGGLVEENGDTTLVVLPEDLQRRLDLPEELQVTADPDVARDAGVTFLGAGHPALGRSADEVLAIGDVAACTIAAPAALPPSIDHLQDAARNQFTVEHGRIDASGSVTRGVRPILRVGAIVDYTLSAEDRYQEVAECWMDARSLRPIATSTAERLVRCDLRPTEPRPGDLIPVVAAADRYLDHAATRRRAELGSDVDKALTAELERVETYYRDQLAQIARRANAAPPDRRELYDARAESTRGEHARRLAETREKYRASHTIRPFRLHLVEVPVWRVPVDVRRGDRRYPLTLDYLMPVGAYAEVPCPNCGSGQTLVATKSTLACTACQVRAVPAPPRAPKPTRPNAAETHTAETTGPRSTRGETPGAHTAETAEPREDRPDRRQTRRRTLERRRDRQRPTRPAVR